MGLAGDPSLLLAFPLPSTVECIQGPSQPMAASARWLIVLVPAAFPVTHWVGFFNSKWQLPCECSHDFMSLDLFLIIHLNQRFKRFPDSTISINMNKLGGGGV